MAIRKLAEFYVFLGVVQVYYSRCHMTCAEENVLPNRL